MQVNMQGLHDGGIYKHQNGRKTNLTGSAGQQMQFAQAELAYQVEENDNHQSSRSSASYKQDVEKVFSII